MELPVAVAKYRPQVEEELTTFLGTHTVGLYQMLRYQFGWSDKDGNPSDGTGGKRVRPVLCLATCEALGGDALQALAAAAAVEMLHNFSLVHDDIEDNSDERHQRPAVWRVWGVAQAINAGDSMHTLARLMLPRMQERGVSPENVLWAGQLIDEASLRLCEGQFMDLLYQEQPSVDMEAYLAMVRGKTASLMSCAMQLGGIIATGDRKVVDTLARCGTKLGIAFQIRDDLLDLAGNRSRETLVGDIVEKKKTFPVVYALQNGTPKTRKDLTALYSKETLHNEDVERVLAILIGSGAIEAADKTAQQYYHEATGLLEELRTPEYDLDILCQFVHFMVNRD
jgi:geranylgeranyl diphosphate synthase type I